MRLIKSTPAQVGRAAQISGVTDLREKILREGGNFDGANYWVREETLREVNPNHPVLKMLAQRGTDDQKLKPVSRPSETESIYKTICEKCDLFEPQIERCDDDKCGCPSAAHRVKPWKNRRTICAKWKT